MESFGDETGSDGNELVGKDGRSLQEYRQIAPGAI
jgi:hypothetical protein